MSATVPALLGFLIVSVATEQLSAQTLLRWKFPEDQPLAYRIEEQTDIVGGDSQLSHTLLLDTCWTAEAVEGEHLKLQVDFRRIRFDAEGEIRGKIKVSYDSSNGTVKAEGLNGKALFQQFDLLAKSTISIRAAPQGQNKEILLPEDLSQFFLRYRELGGYFGESVTELGLRRMLTKTLITLPEKQVAEGEEWQCEYHLALTDVLEVAGQTEYVLKKGEDESAMPISFTTDETLKLQRKKPNGEPYPEKKRKTTGAARFDPSAGHLLSLEAQTSMGAIRFSTRIALGERS